MTMLAVVPARGGSKGIPRKNLKPFCGKPLLAWTVEAAQASGVFRRIILSTEDQEIAEVGRAYGAEVPFLRPGALAEDRAPTAPVIRHTLEWLKEREGWLPEAVMVLDPTSPGRRPVHIRDAAACFRNNGVGSVASVSEVPHHYVPSKILHLHRDGTVTGVDGTPVRQMIHRRQDVPTYYAFNGLLFACKTALLWRQPPTLWGEQVFAYVVDAKYALDLDEPEDWPLGEQTFERILQEEAGFPMGTVHREREAAHDGA